MSFVRFGFLFALVLLATTSNGVRADEDGYEQDEAHRAVQGGEIRPLSEILARLPRGVAGEVVRVRLKQKEGRLVYELRRVNSQGRLSEITVDATTGAEISEEGD